MNKVKIEALVQARMSSRRLPGKVLLELGGEPVILHVVNRIRKSKLVDTVRVLTSDTASDDPLFTFLHERGVPVFRGSLEDVHSRFCSYVIGSDADLFIRVTADCPVIDPQVIDSTIQLHLETGGDYTSNSIIRSFPRGLDVEVFPRQTLFRLKEEFGPLTDAEKEHVTIGIYSRPKNFRLTNYQNLLDLSIHRWTLDTQGDYEFLTRIFDSLPKGNDWGWREILGLIEANPQLAHLEP